MAIKVNQELNFYATSDPTKESKPVAIRDLCEDVKSEKLTIPIYQTYLRWSVEKYIALFNFQLLGKAAVSPISINVIEDPSFATQQLTLIDRQKISSDRIKGKLSLNDGQQRISCNYMAFIDHQDLKCIVLDLSKGKFVYNTKQLRTSQIPVGVLYNDNDDVFSSYIEENKQFQPFKIQSLLMKIRTKHFGYFYTVNYAKDLSQREQEDWFEVLNNAGTRVTGLHLHMTEMLAKGIDFYKDCSIVIYDKFCESDLEHLFFVKTTETSAPFSMLNASYEKHFNKKHKLSFSPIPSDAKGALMGSLEADDIKAIILMTISSVERALQFIEENELPLPDKIDYVSYLAGAFSFIGDNALSQMQIDGFIDWYKKENFEYKGDNFQRRQSFETLVNLARTEDN